MELLPRESLVGLLPTESDKVGAMDGLFQKSKGLKTGIVIIVGCMGKLLKI